MPKKGGRITALLNTAPPRWSTHLVPKTRRKHWEIEVKLKLPNRNSRGKNRSEFQQDQLRALPLLVLNSEWSQVSTPSDQRQQVLQLSASLITLFIGYFLIRCLHVLLWTINPTRPQTTHILESKGSTSMTITCQIEGALLCVYESERQRVSFPFFTYLETSNLALYTKHNPLLLFFIFWVMRK